ncbi:26049_t:CDS:1, partial [Gigaspora rosea]
MQLRTFFVFILVIITASVNAIPNQLGKRTSDYEPSFPLSLTAIPDNLVPNMNTSFTISAKLDKRTSGYEPCFPNKQGLSVTTKPANLLPNTKTQFNVTGDIGQYTSNTKIEVNLLDEFQKPIYGFNGEGCPCPNAKCPCNSKGVLISVNAFMKDIPDKYYIVVDLFLSSHAGQPDA